MAKHPHNLMYWLVGAALLPLFAVSIVLAMPPDSKAQVLFQPGGPEYEAQLKEAEAAKPRVGSTDPGSEEKVSCNIFSDGIGCAIYWFLDVVSDFFINIILSWVLIFFESAVNLALYPIGNITFVQMGFKITLGVANMFFVLILLWIAIATIFGFEPYTARSLLMRLIISALLINFSLTIGSAFINLSNGIARIFYDQLQSPLTLSEAERQGIVGQYLPLAPIASRVMLASKFAVVKDTRPKNPITFGEAGSQIQRDCYTQLSAIPGVGVIQCLSSIWDAGWRLTFRQPKLDVDLLSVALTATLFKLTITPILIFVLLASAIFLLIRTLSLAFLLVLGPIAFLFMILPATRPYYNQWWERLAKWSFFFPAFMFFIFLSLQTGSGFAQVFVTAGSSDRLPAFMQFILIAGLLLGSLMVAHQMGIYGAGTVTGWGKKLAGAAGKWTKGTGKILAGRAAGAALGSSYGQRLASRRYLRHMLRPLEATTVAGSKISEQRQKTSAARRAAAISAADIRNINLTLGGMRDGEERVRFLKELRKTNRLAFEAAVPNINAPQLQPIYQEAQRRHEDEFAEQLVTAARDLNTRLEIITGLDRADPNFQQAVNAQLAVMKSEMLQRIVSADDIRDANGAMNQYLEPALLNALDIDALRSLGNNPEKAARLSQFFGDQLGGRQAYAGALAAGRNDHQARMEGIQRAIDNLRTTNEDLANQIQSTAAVRINIAYGRPLARRASAIPVAGPPPPAPPPTP